MFINWKLREISLKLVYYGASLCGKTTNLEFIHANLQPEARGQLISLKTREDRTIFFDFMQIEFGAIKGLKPKFNLYTVPGQVYYMASRKLVLQGADGVIFVVDSQASRLTENIEAWENLQANLREMGHDVAKFPVFVQYNKRDLPDALPLADLQRRFSSNGFPPIQAVATRGVGVFETLKPAMRVIMGRVTPKL